MSKQVAKLGFRLAVTDSEQRARLVESWARAGTRALCDLEIEAQPRSPARAETKHTQVLGVVVYELPRDSEFSSQRCCINERASDAVDRAAPNRS